HRVVVAVRYTLRHHAPLQPAICRREKPPHVWVPSLTTKASACLPVSGSHPRHQWHMPPRFRTAGPHTHQPHSLRRETVRGNRVSTKKAQRSIARPPVSIARLEDQRERSPHPSHLLPQ